MKVSPGVADEEVAVVASVAAEVVVVSVAVLPAVGFRVVGDPLRGRLHDPVAEAALGDEVRAAERIADHRSAPPAVHAREEGLQVAVPGFSQGRGHRLVGLAEDWARDLQSELAVRGPESAEGPPVSDLPSAPVRGSERV